MSTPTSEIIEKFPSAIKLIFEQAEKIIRTYFKDVSVEIKVDYKYEVPKPDNWPAELPEPSSKLAFSQFLVKGIRMGKVEVDGLWVLYVGPSLEKNSVVVFYEAKFKIDHDTKLLYLKLNSGTRNYFYTAYNGREVQKLVADIVSQIAKWIDQSIFAQRQAVVALVV